jgi:hypothetical protein
VLGVVDADFVNGRQYCECDEGFHLITRVCAECKEVCDVFKSCSARGVCATHDDGENVDMGRRPKELEHACEGRVFRLVALRDLG